MRQSKFSASGSLTQMSRYSEAVEFEMPMLKLLDLIAPKKSADSNIITLNVGVISYGQEISQVTPDLAQKAIE